MLPQLLAGQVIEEMERPEKVKNPYHKRAYAGFGLGMAIPMGLFRSNDDFELVSAYAENGFSMHIVDVGYRLKDVLIAGGFYLNATNPINENLYARALGYKNDYSYEMETTSYELKAVLLGIGISKSSNSLDLDLRFLAGYGNTFVPAFTIKETNTLTLESWNYEIPSQKKGGAGVGLNLGLRIHLTPYLDLNNQLSYIVFQRNFEELIDTQNQSIRPSEFSYEIINLTFGLAYRFIDE